MSVLLLQLFHPTGLFQLQTTVFLPPAIVGWFGDARFPAGLPGGLMVGYSVNPIHFYNGSSLHGVVFSAHINQSQLSFSKTVVDHECQRKCTVDSPVVESAGLAGALADQIKN